MGEMSSMVSGAFLLAVPFMLLGCSDEGTTPAPTTTLSPAYGLYQWTREDKCPAGSGSWIPPTPRAKRVVYGECMTVSNESVSSSWLWQGPTYVPRYDQEHNVTLMFYFDESRDCTGSNRTVDATQATWDCDQRGSSSHSEWTLSWPNVSFTLYGGCGVPPEECGVPPEKEGSEVMESLV